jgi:phosphoenolpyruvate synthase/pyruvate phosphate dikinase
MTQWVYSFGAGRNEGRADMRNLLGGKGANLAEMASIGLPVPPGFTITTEVCTYFYEQREPTRPSLRPGERRRSRASKKPSATNSATITSRCSSPCAPARAPPCRA